MDADERLRALWQGQALPETPPQQLLQRVRRHRRRVFLRRAFEAALSLAALLWFSATLLTRPYTPVEWLLLPYFSVFLIVVWTLVLRHATDYRAAAESTRVYAGLRLAQLRAQLRELHIARRSAQLLLAYAAAALIVMLMWGTPPWQQAALRLVIAATAWLIGCEFFITRSRRRCRREYRALRRLRDA